MRYVAPPQVNLRPLEAVRASLSGWLGTLLVWFCDVLDTLPPWAQRTPLLREAGASVKARVAADLRRSVYAFSYLIVAHASARMRYDTPRPRRRIFPGSAHPDQRCARRANVMRRRLTHGILSGMHEGSLRQRAERLRDALANLEPFVAHVLKRMRKLWRHRQPPALIVVASRDACASVAEMPAVACADTS